MDRPFPAYKGDDPYVFVCYAHDDEDVVFPEMAWLHEQGINLWYDEGISAGRIWREEIGDAIKGASKVLYSISESSVEHRGVAALATAVLTIFSGIAAFAFGLGA